MGNTIADNGHEGIPVVEAEWSHAVTSAANFDGLSETEFAFVILHPKGFSFFVAVCRGLVLGVSVLAK